jgi:glycerol uptake facilitator-like aquaporin
MKLAEPMIDSLNQKRVAEALGTCILVATVVGSGIMAEQLSGGNIAIALLGNTIPTGAILVVLISILGPISGAHFNPVVSLCMAIKGKLNWSHFLNFTVCQIAGAIAGAWIAHAMFDLSILQISTKLRWGQGQWIAELVASFGLLLTIFGAIRSAPKAVPTCVGLYITAAYWFTASTSFANPAVTIARSLSNTFSGISPISVLPFIAAQIMGGLLATAAASWLFNSNGAESKPTPGRDGG